MSFTADVLKCNHQLFFVVHETVRSYTAALAIENKKDETLREVLARLIMELHPLDCPMVFVTVDSVPGFISLRDDSLLNKLHITLETGRIKKCK